MSRSRAGHAASLAQATPGRTWLAQRIIGRSPETFRPLPAAYTLRDLDVAVSTEAAAMVHRLFSSPSTAYIQVHGAKPVCFFA